ncbi:MAG: ABC transporter permease [Treponema sp.]|nr:ABC transporter permease [Treponema sp.]
MIDSLLTAAAPLLLAALGALVTDLAGTLGIFIEGFMTLGSFCSWIIAGKTGSVFWGSLASGLIMAAAGWALACFVRRTGANPFIAALALNLAAGGITGSLSAAWFGTGGVLRNPGSIVYGPVRIPFIGDLPLLGPVLSGHLPYVYLSWICAAAAAVVTGKTTLGLRLRAAGRSPEAALERGIRTGLYREGAWAAAAFLAALAGAALTFRVGAYTPGGSAGRGWIALAAVYLGFRTVWGTVAAALLFAAAELAGLGIQGLGALPATVLLGFPPALALGLYAVSSRIGKRQKDGKR